MGAHSAAGHGSRRTVTATAGVAAALLTTAATGLLTGGTALATDGWDGSGSSADHGGSGHAHGHGHSSHPQAGRDSDSASTAGSGLAAQAWCDVMGDVDLGDGYSCASDGPSDGSGSADDTTADDATASNAAATAPAAPAPKPRPTSSVPDHPTVQPIVAPPSGRKVVPIA
jgi:hypothetical protein